METQKLKLYVAPDEPIVILCDDEGECTVATIEEENCERDQAVKDGQDLVKRYNAYPELIEAIDNLLRHCVTAKGMPDMNKGRTDEQQAAYSKAIKLLADSTK